MRGLALAALCAALALGIVPRAQADLRHRSVHAPERKVESVEMLLAELETHREVLGPAQLQALRGELLTARRRAFSAPPGKREGGERQNAGETHLRGDFDDYTPTKWVPPSLGTSVSPLAGKTYQVVVYEILPFVRIADEKGLVDPGNVNQTRTSANGDIAGLTIELLEEVASQLDIELKYYFPCEAAVHEETGECDEGTAADSLEMLDDAAGKYLGTDVAGWCANDACFAAGANKITPQSVPKYMVVSSFMTKGFSLVTLQGKPQPVFMSWAEPFEFGLWMLVLAELAFCTILFMICEGYGTNDSLWGISTYREGSGWLPQIYDAGYWAMTLVLGAADKAPTTNAGRIVVFGQLLFALFFIALYTGNLSATLTSLKKETAVLRLDDFKPGLAGIPKVPAFRKDYSICIPTKQSSIASYVEVQENLAAAAGAPFTFNTVNATTVADCLDMVYKGEATATFYDEPVLLYQINGMYGKGMCGTLGGYCSDPAFDKEKCLCPEKDVDGNCLNLNNNEFKGVEGELTTVGGIFHPFGYGFMFKKSDTATDYIAMGQVVQYLKDSGFVESLERLHIPAITSLVCGSSSGSSIQLGVDNISGLLTITGAVLMIGLALGLMEQIIAVVICLCPRLAGGAKEDEEEIDIEQENKALEDEFKEMDEEGEEPDEVVSKVQALKDRLAEFELLLSGEDAEDAGEQEPDHIILTLGRSISKYFSPRGS